MNNNKNSLKNICVYMGAYNGGDPVYKENAINLGTQIGTRGYGMVYGGARSGLMYDIASTAQKNGAFLYGVMPTTLVDGEQANYDCDEWEQVDNMHVRKMKMCERADGFVIFPGGLGTLDELAEILSWNQLDIMRKPVCIFNVNNYWDPFITLIDHMVNEGLLKTEKERLFTVATSVEEIFTCLEQQDISPINKWS